MWDAVKIIRDVDIFFVELRNLQFIDILLKNLDFCLF